MELRGTRAGSVTVAAVPDALQDRGNVYPELAMLDVLSVNVRAALLREGRDVTGGVPETDDPEAHVT